MSTALPHHGGTVPPAGSVAPGHGSTVPRRGGALRQWWDGWWHLAFLVLNLLTAIPALVITVLALAGLLTTPALGVGLLLLAPAMWAARLFGRCELGRVEAFLGQRIKPEPVQANSRWTVALGVSRAHRRAAVYVAVHTLWGLLSGALVTVVTGALVAILAVPAYRHLIPEDGLHLVGSLRLQSPAIIAVVWAVALVGTLLLPLVARALTQVDTQLTRSLLGTDPEAEIAELSERVATLAHSREETVDSVESERRRIERDLHDGPQQRLVAIAMDLGMARTRMTHDPEGAQELLDKAHRDAKDAIVEMRQVARGIVPPILADRGLDAAISALAARSPVPVTVAAGQVGRWDPTTEAIGYFCVSELLTNIAKHSQAQAATVRLSVVEDGPHRLLQLEVEDDGVGGADPRLGTGLSGLRQRVAAVDGTMDTSSPPGGPTRVRITVPDRTRAAGGAR